MRKMTRRWPTLVGIITLLFLATACFQQVGDEAQGQVVSVRATEIPPTIPPNTPIPAPSDTPTDVEVQDVVVLNNATATHTPSPSNTPLRVAQDALQQPTVGVEGTATVLVREATERAALPTTQAAAAMGIGLTPATLTFTPAPFGFQGTTPFFQPGQDCVYEVRAGDTMWNISRRFSMSVMEIVNPNGLTNFNLIVIGDRLTIPHCGDNPNYFPPSTSTPVPSITPYGFGVSSTPEVRAEGLVVPQPITCQSQYTVQQYDTLYSISVRFGVPIQSIVNANPDVIYNQERINMGDTICIPSQ